MEMAHRQPAIGRRALELVLVALALLVTLAPPAYGEDRVAALSRMLASRSDKTRLAAALALAKLGEPRADKPLIRALRDPSARVRGVAAVALGRLECGAALPALRALAQGDADPDVRKAASTAAIKISAGHPGGRDGRTTRPDGEVWARRSVPGAEHPGHPALAAEPHPDLHVLINSSTDESPGAADRASRRQNADLVRRALLERLRSDARVTALAGDARRWALGTRHLDLSVIRLAATRSGDTIEVDAQLRIAISDDSGRMLSLLSGGAKVQVPARRFDAGDLPALRKEALDNAIRGMSDKLLAQLRDAP